MGGVGHIDGQAKLGGSAGQVLYVSISRARADACVYTDSVQDMRRAAARTQEKELALDVIQRQQTQQSTGLGMRI